MEKFILVVLLASIGTWASIASAQSFTMLGGAVGLIAWIMLMKVLFLDAPKETNDN